MKAFYKPSNILFYILSALLFLLLGTILAGITGAGKNQGLAGSAIVLGYGVISGFVAFIAAIVTARLVKENLVILLNKIFAALFLLLIALFIYRFQTRQDALNLRTQPTSGQASSTTPTAYAQTNAGDDFPPMGLGMAAPMYYENRVVYFYGDLNLEKPVSDHMPTDSLVFERRETGFELASAPPWFVPAHLKLDYNMLFLHVVSLQAEFIEVMVNETDGQTAFMDRFKFDVRFWPEFLLTINSVEQLYPQDYPVRVKPLSHGAPVSTQYTFLKPLRISSHWMEVELLDERFQSRDKGWIKWQENGKLLITYSLLS